MYSINFFLTKNMSHVYSDTETHDRLHWTLGILSLALPNGDFHLQVQGEGTGFENRALGRKLLKPSGLQLLHLPFQDCRAVLCCMEHTLFHAAKICYLRSARETHKV